MKRALQVLLRNLEDILAPAQHVHGALGLLYHAEDADDALEAVEEAHTGKAEEPGPAHDGQRYRQDQGGVAEASQELGIVASAQQAPQGKEHDLIVLPVVQQLFEYLPRDIRVDAVDRHIEHLDSFHFHCTGVHSSLS